MTEGFLLKLLQLQSWTPAMQVQKSIAKLQSHPAGSSVFTRMSTVVVTSFHHTELMEGAQENMLYLLLGPACPWATLGMPKTSPQAS